MLSPIFTWGRRDAQDNFQIFNIGQRLGNLIRHIAKQRSDEDVALVLNGDMIDSLAEEEVPGYVALDSQTALRMMAHIYQDDACRPVWEGLAEFVKTPKRHLVFVIGNHDIELSLPIVENSIRLHLDGADESVQDRIRQTTRARFTAIIHHSSHDNIFMLKKPGLAFVRFDRIKSTPIQWVMDSTFDMST
jgi:hypothetical protein